VGTAGQHRGENRSAGAALSTVPAELFIKNRNGDELNSFATL
jgi:hypothetical protein